MSDPETITPEPRVDRLSQIEQLPAYKLQLMHKMKAKMCDGGDSIFLQSRRAIFAYRSDHDQLAAE